MTFLHIKTFAKLSFLMMYVVGNKQTPTLPPALSNSSDASAQLRELSCCKAIMLSGLTCNPEELEYPWQSMNFVLLLWGREVSWVREKFQSIGFAYRLHVLVTQSI